MTRLHESKELRYYSAIVGDRLRDPRDALLVGRQLAQSREGG